MTDRPFVHLHCHTHYSLLDGASRIPELVAHAKKLGMNALALTDHGNLYGAIEFYRECTDAGINPIIGYEAYVAPSKRTDREARTARRGRLSPDAAGPERQPASSNLDQDGLGRLPRGLPLRPAHRQGTARRPITKGIICLSGCASSEFSEFILKDQMDEAGKTGRVVRTSCSARISTSKSRTTAWTSSSAVPRAPSTSPTGSACRWWPPATPIISARPTPPPTTCCCASTPAGLRNDENRMRYGSDQFYVRAAGGDVPALSRPRRGRAAQPGNRRRLSTSSSTSRNGTSPSSRRRTGKTPEDYLRELCESGLQERYGASSRLARRPRDRLEHELGIICRMGFASYFLIVWDFVRFAVEQRHPGQRPRLGVRRHRQLRPEAEPRLSARIRPAVRALPRSQPQRGARHRHRLLPGSPRGSDRLRPRRSTARQASPRSAPSAPWRPGPRSRTWAGSWTCRSSASIG